MVKAKKHFGQHFLVNKGIIDRIIASLELQPEDRLLEIGPGPGTLTIPINKLGHGLTAVEFDLDMVHHLENLTWEPPLEVIHADFMKVSLDEVIPTETKIVSNLPYNVSVPITARLLKVKERVPLMVMMYQKEVAERIRAKPGCKDYGPISVLVQAFYHIPIHFNVAPGSFRPPPKVMSQVIVMRRRDDALLQVADLAQITTLVRHVFTHRRKTLGANIKRWSQGWGSKELLMETLIQIGIDPRARPETLSLEEYINWYHQIKEKL